MTIVPVSFEIGPARYGWIRLTVTAGDQSDTISCSSVYDPWEYIVRWVEQAALGYPGAVDIDEEGCTTILWLDREPGSLIGRLRVFEPDEHDGVETGHIDATIDIAQMCKAFLEAFSSYASTYDATHWDDDVRDSVDTILSRIDLGRIRSVLCWMRLVHDDNPLHDSTDWWAAERDKARENYERQLGVHALPME